ncbi:uncharacterized protein UV8b_02153 [Ustilaginoidea virens]|uniref:G-protein coupled receptors family 2 profile 2 domain-containing protein n=1 Tax=Ustilaginoidea virens TaxID=1159556 RepID=A0A8E5MFK4_USTVR|nr:uncharacterized protein UV8b_02153 [Ustilaginoidea virens]QUC17912.1 hypothetical protein UV8b_02153 [Ustilaginoidea virens]
MVNLTGVNLCPPPFADSNLFSHSKGYVDGRLCQTITEDLKCCLPCPLTRWVYPDSFDTLTLAANWVATVGLISCIYLLASWVVLPVEKTCRHYLSVCMTLSILLISLGLVVPLAAQPEQCYDTITPNSMSSSRVCGASGTFLMLGGWSVVVWAFLRSLSLHLQICWQVLVGRSFMFFAHAAGWGIPLIDLCLSLVFSGVSFRFGPTCHINHKNSLAVFWIPLSIFAGATVIITFATFGYCVKVYILSLKDTSASTEASSLPTYTNSLRTVTPRQAYRRVKRVIALQWRGIAIVLIIICDVIFFTFIFVFQDNLVQAVKSDPKLTEKWVMCLIGSAGDKNACLEYVGHVVVNEATVSSVLFLLALNGLFASFLLGRLSMAVTWVELFKSLLMGGAKQKEFVSVDARQDLKNDPWHSRSYEMISKDSGAAVKSTSPVKSPSPCRYTPDYSRQTSPYHAPASSFSSPRSPQQTPGIWQGTPAGPDCEKMNPLGMNKI